MAVLWSHGVTWKVNYWTYYFIEVFLTRISWGFGAGVLACLAIEAVYKKTHVQKKNEDGNNAK